ncbi:MAG: NAD(P)/FAD-dependent oxidoreductase [Deltaproteobacteria bacterium]|nr:NAD(P)/FAD-dependent oxidoreductase [Deltaproteobacteria bacterium]
MTARGADFDVAIIGGGPAGASTALHLVHEQGIRPDRIVIVDKARFPRDKPCAGAISQQGIDALAALGIRVKVPFVAMRGVRVIMRDDVGETACERGIVIRRVEFDAQLLEEARAAGAIVREGEGLHGLERTAAGFRVVTRSETFTARFVAACDGAGSPTRKLLGLKEPERKGHLYVMETEATPADQGVARGLIDFDLTVLDDGLEGYYWDFPTVVDGVRAVSRGIYHANLEREEQGVDVKGALARALAKRGIDIARVKLKPFSTRPYVPGTTLAQDGVVLVGEAAGIDRTTGEGIAQAIVMSGIAARHLARALRTGLASFEGYARAVRAATIGRHMLQSAWLARRVYGRIGEPARQLLLRSSFAREAAMRWYHGESLPMAVQLRLGLGLVTPALA